MEHQRTLGKTYILAEQVLVQINLVLPLLLNLRAQVARSETVEEAVAAMDRAIESHQEPDAEVLELQQEKGEVELWTVLRRFPHSTSQAMPQLRGERPE
ncbi:MAG: hypothetical protein IH855_02770 [Bacteroidetes bacterium]|nr:hypothetical protein [Bacteroidota bacterium]